ncbi:reprolysin-like metallopeptidase [Bdellovibrio bacteriovorus]|uniref:reprolysin-like metallopeptidase n=1 Tax=Bdellovibrio TaxID=958 RepID=UPI0035A96E02
MKKIVYFSIATLFHSGIVFAQKQPESFVGSVTVVHKESFTKARSETTYEFRGERKGRSPKKYQLKMKGKIPENLMTGTQVQIEGAVDGSILNASSLKFLLSDSSLSSTSEPVAVGVGMQNTIVVLLNFQNSPQVCTKTQVDSLMFTGKSSVNKFYQENSYGKVGFKGVVTEPVTIEAPSIGNCDLSSISSRGDAAAGQAGYDLSSFQRRVYVLPPNSLNCSWTGAAYIGGNRSFINSDGCNNSMVYAHELGHNLGMDHASSVSGEYGDHSDVMANPSTPFHYNSFHKIAMGWIPSSRISVMSGLPGSVGDYKVAHIEQDISDIQTVKIPIAGTVDSFFISYRRGLGFDSVLSAQFLDSVSIHKAGLGTKSILLGTVKVGGTWFDSSGALKVQMLSRDSTYASIRVEVASPDVSAPSVPTNLQASMKTMTYGKGRRAVTTTAVHLSWTASMDDRGVQRYIIERNGEVYTIVPATNATFDDSYVQRGATYTYRIQAVDTAGNISEHSLPLVITP